MVDFTFLYIEVAASIIGGLAAGGLSLFFLKNYKRAGQTAERFSEKLGLGKRTSFVLFTVAAAIIHGLIVSAVRTSGLVRNVSLMMSTPYLLPFTILYSIAMFLGLWNYFRDGGEKGERNQWIKVAVLYSFVLNIVSGFLTFFLGMLVFFS
ncbi:MAG: hypothetical protein ACLFTQ_00005 [Candidatus Aenigmatarchaeota archaeon]